MHMDQYRNAPTKSAMGGSEKAREGGGCVQGGGNVSTWNRTKKVQDGCVRILSVPPPPPSVLAHECGEDGVMGGGSVQLERLGHGRVDRASADPGPHVVTARCDPC